MDRLIIIYFLLGYKYIILIFICLFSVIVLISLYTMQRTDYENDCEKYTVSLFILNPSFAFHDVVANEEIAVLGGVWTQILRMRNIVLTTNIMTQL